MQVLATPRPAGPTIPVSGQLARPGRIGSARKPAAQTKPPPGQSSFAMSHGCDPKPMPSRRAGGDRRRKVGERQQRHADRLYRVLRAHRACRYDARRSQPRRSRALRASERGRIRTDTQTGLQTGGSAVPAPDNVVRPALDAQPLYSARIAAVSTAVRIANTEKTLPSPSRWRIGANRTPTAIVSSQLDPHELELLTRRRT